MTKRLTTRLGAVLALAMTVLAATAGAAAAAPSIEVKTLIPDYVTAGKQTFIWVSILNTGTDPLNGNLTIRFTMPPGVSPVEPENQSNNFPWSCPVVGQVQECIGDATGLQPGVQTRLKWVNLVGPSASGTLNGSFEVSGGGTSDVFTEPFSFIVGPSGPFAIKAFDVGMDDTPAGLPPTRAGSDPTAVTSEVKLPSEAQTNFDLPYPNLALVAPTESFRDVIAHVPPGFVGNPKATPVRCTANQLTTPFPFTVIPQCPAESQIGIVQLNSGDLVPLYNIEAPNGSPAEFGFFYASIVVTLLPKVRPDDYGIDLVTQKAPSSIPVPGVEVTLWGVPSDASHDPLRSVCLQGGYGYNSTGGLCKLSVRSRVPFLRTPTSCPGTPLRWGLDLDTYQHPGTFVHAQTATAPTEGCQDNPFHPEFALVPSSQAPHAPSGVDATIAMDQGVDPEGIAPADVKRVNVELPDGVTINPSSADGLAACTDAQLGLGQEGAATCPDGSKLGTVTLRTPLLEEPIGGSVFLRTQNSDDPASGEMYRLALEIRSDERGVDIKLPGQLEVDPTTGRLTTTFSSLPQLPFESMDLHLKAGPRAPLSTPSACGTYNSHAVITSWGDRTVTLDTPFTVDQNCTAPGFKPGFEAGVADSTAGRFAPFSLRVTRDSGEPNVSRIDATLPEGELAKLAGVPVCGAVQAASGECPAASRIGSVVSGIGEGVTPLYLPQAGKAPTAVYLAAPYKGAPYSILAEVPAQAGPFDLGKVLVRSALRIDPETTQATVASDPLPQIFGGIPVSYRDVQVQVDRPDFTLNPTDCEPTAVKGAITSIEGQKAQVSDRFQVGECASLGFKPKLSITLKGQAQRTGHPALKAVLEMPQGGANVSRASVALPHSEFLASNHIRTSCTRVQYNAGPGGGAGCPKGSVYGRARAISPLLDRPLEGPVYLRSNGGDRKLPDLVASLDGQIHVDLVGYIDTDKKTNGLRTTFAHVPDAPVSKFVLRMPAGQKSLLENSTDICHGKHQAVVRFGAQNGRVQSFKPQVRAKCGKGARKR